MDDPVARYARFLPASWERRTAGCGGSVHRIDGLAVFLTGSPRPWFNATLVDGDVGDPPAALVEAERRYPDGLGFGIDLDPERNGSVREACGAIGLALLSRRPSMSVAPRDVPRVEPPEGMSLGRIVEARDLDAVAEVDTAAFGGHVDAAPPTDDVDATRGFLPDAMLDDPAQRVYGAWVDGRLVAVGEATTIDGTTGLFGIATHPAFQRRGIASALVSLQVRDRAEDADVVLLDASEAGRKVYERLGFTVFAEREVWSRPTPLG